MKKTFAIATTLIALTLVQIMNLLENKTTLNQAQAASTQASTTAQVLGVYFTPPRGAAQAIVNAIDASQHQVLVQAYSFTHNAIAQALVRARQRGVDVKVLMDEKSDNSNRYVIGVLSAGQVSMREDGKHAIAHNKVIVIDDEIVVTGSFNFTNAAEQRNAENFLILKSSDLARQYKNNWQNHWEHSQ
jgi:phosphatidylserine/phosphatidylglycerophosphate/cardiolipin synthase-like enzyme